MGKEVQLVSVFAYNMLQGKLKYYMNFLRVNWGSGRYCGAWMKYALLGLKNMRAQNAPPAEVLMSVKFAKWNIFQNVGYLYMQRMRVLVWRDKLCGPWSLSFEGDFSGFIWDVYEKLSLLVGILFALIHAFLTGLFWLLVKGFILDFKNHPFSGMVKFLAIIL